MYLLAPFILKYFQKILRADPELWGYVIFEPKMTPEQIFFGTNHYYYLHLPIAPFHCAKFLKKFYSRSRVMRMHHFWAQNGPYASNNFFFFWKIINIILICLLAPFIVKNFIKILPADLESWGCTTLGYKIDHFPKWEFFQKSC